MDFVDEVLICEWSEASGETGSIKRGWELGKESLDSCDRAEGRGRRSCEMDIDTGGKWIGFGGREVAGNETGGGKIEVESRKLFP